MPGIATVGRLDDFVLLMKPAEQVGRVIGIDDDRVEAVVSTHP